MKLYFWNAKKNFGDLLNPWLWSRMLPGLLDEDEDSVFLGIGTILSIQHGVDLYPHKVVLGSGTGYGKLPVIDESWTIYSVRGPLTAKALGLTEATGIIDPGILVRQYIAKETHPPRYRFSFMPHFVHNLDAWRCVAKEIGMGFVDPQEDVEMVIQNVLDCEVLITEAMHGAIVADAFGRAWIPVTIGKDEEIIQFKWQDWCLTVNLTYRTNHLPLLFELPPRADYFLKQHTRFTRFFARRALQNIAKRVKPFLSNRQHLATREAQLLEKVEEFRRDVASGRFAKASNSRLSA
jgi:succinoglycan biosynthesis protein ExoV